MIDENKAIKIIMKRNNVVDGDELAVVNEAVSIAVAVRYNLDIAGKYVIVPSPFSLGAFKFSNGDFSVDINEDEDGVYFDIRDNVLTRFVQVYISYTNGEDNDVRASRLGEKSYAALDGEEKHKVLQRAAVFLSENDDAIVSAHDRYCYELLKEGLQRVY